MQHPPLRRVLSVATIFTIIVVAAPAPAQVVDGIPTSVVATPNAPLAITSCKVGRNVGPYGDPLNAVVTNRTSHAVLSVGVQIRYYDQDGTLVGQGAPTRTLEAPLAGGDDAALQFSSGADLSEPAAAIVRATCRLQSATFTGNKKWTYGRTWTEKLLPLKTAQREAGEGEGARSTGAVRTRPHVQVTVTRTWTDTLDGVLYVHDALAIAGSPDGPARERRPQDVRRSCAGGADLPALEPVRQRHHHRPRGRAGRGLRPHRDDDGPAARGRHDDGHLRDRRPGLARRDLPRGLAAVKGRLLVAPAVLVLALALGGCTAAGAQHHADAAAVVRKTASLVGTWTLFGGEPKPSYRQTFTILRMAFHPGGKVDVRYLPEPAPMLAFAGRSAQMRALAPTTRRLVYIDHGAFVELAMGSDLVRVDYELRDDGRLLLLRMPHASVTKIYRRMR